MWGRDREGGVPDIDGGAPPPPHPSPVKGEGVMEGIHSGVESAIAAPAANGLDR